MKKYLKQWQDIVFIALLIVGVVLCVVATLIQNEYFLKAFIICMATICVFLAIIMAMELLKTFKKDNKQSNGKWKTKTLMFWIDILFMFSGVATYLLLAFAIILMNITMVNICVICSLVYLLSIPTKTILFMVQNKKRFKGERV